MLINELTWSELKSLFNNMEEKFEGDSILHAKIRRHKDKLDAEKAIAVISRVFPNIEIAIYMAPDNDLFIHTKPVTQKNLNRLNYAYVELFGLENPLVDHIEIYSGSLSKIHSIINANLKVESKNLIQAKQRQKEREEDIKRQAILNKNPNDDLVKSIKSRRASSENIKILVVEDDLFSAKLVKNSLKGTAEIFLAHDGKDAISKYASSAPHIVFLDINLPDVSGHDLIEKFLEMDNEAHIIMLSGNGDKPNIVKAISNGAKSFVAKPFSKERLQSHVEQFKLELI